MMRILILAALAATAAHAEDATVAFRWFEYTGKDAVFEAPLPR
jgi:hypothetical protein